MLRSLFKVLCADAGLSLEEAAKLLHVTPRTTRYWFSGKVTVPYAAYKLVRVLRWFELPGAAWAGWHFYGGKLCTPEGYAFEPQDSNLVVAAGPAGARAAEQGRNGDAGVWVQAMNTKRY